MSHREEFSDETKKIIAKRAAYRCSFPGCDRVTIGPGKAFDKVTLVGEAAHIYSASRKGPRGQSDLTSQQLCSPQNGIWFCRVHSRIPDLNNGRDYPPSMLHSYKALHESKVARELGEITCPFGWLEELTIRASPFVRTAIEIHFTKATIFLGGMGSGKTTAAHYLASALSPEALGKVMLPEFLDSRHEYGLIYHCPDRHRLDVSISNGKIVYRFDDIHVPFNPLPFKVLMLPAAAHFGGRISHLAEAFGLPAGVVKQALDHLPIERPGVFEAVRVVDSDLIEIYRDGKFLPSQYLSGGGRKMFMLECAIALATFSANHLPTLLILDDGLHRLDQEHRAEYLQRLNDPAFQFQTILIDVSGRKDEAWGGWQYVCFGEDLAASTEAQLSDEKRANRE